MSDKEGIAEIPPKSFDLVPGKCSWEIEGRMLTTPLRIREQWSRVGAHNLIQLFGLEIT